EAVEVLAVEVVEFEAEALEARQVPALGGAHVPALEVLGGRVEGAREAPRLPGRALVEAAAGGEAVAGARVAPLEIEGVQEVVGGDDEVGRGLVVVGEAEPVDAVGGAEAEEAAQR